MAFRYSLQSLLRLRLSLERQEEQRLFAIAALVARLRAEIEQLKQDDVEVRRSQLGEMGEVSSGASLQFAAACGAAREKARTKLEFQLEGAERKRHAQLRAYQSVRQKREILESLRERQEEAFELENMRREQQAVDESFLIRSRVVFDE
jgi:flagellar export protein FliJ